MKVIKNHIIDGSYGRPIIMDLYYQENQSPTAVIVFAHGYKGFKDWGAWELMAQKIAESGRVFIKFNFSHNGGIPENPIDFPDLNAFKENTYTKERDDYNAVIDWLYSDHGFKFEFYKIMLIGHSRGGGIASLVAQQNSRVHCLVTLAAVSDFEKRFPQGDDYVKWKEKGVYHVKNARTGQQMPHSYNFYKDFIKNRGSLNIQKALRLLDKPCLIIHGDSDKSVGLEEAYALKLWCPNASLEVVRGTGHTFGMKHPWTEKELPGPMQFVVQRIIDFCEKGN